MVSIVSCSAYVGPFPRMWDLFRVYGTCSAYAGPVPRIWYLFRVFGPIPRMYAFRWWADDGLTGSFVIFQKQYTYGNL